MKGSILDLYEEIKNSGQRFVDEIFDKEIYKEACPKLTIIDAGAYEGEFSFYCLNFAKKIYAFEPDPKPWQIFHGRIGSYDLHDKIELSAKALAGTTGKGLFHASGGGGSRLISTGEQEYVKTDEGFLPVETLSLTDLFTEKNIEQVDIFKIDIEGGEDTIFQSPEFPELSKKIKVIIGEHIGPSDEILRNLGFSARDVSNGNILYERKT